MDFTLLKGLFKTNVDQEKYKIKETKCICLWQSNTQVITQTTHFHPYVMRLELFTKIWYRCYAKNVMKLVCNWLVSQLPLSERNN